MPGDTAYDTDEETLQVTTISAQNTELDGHSPDYGIGSGGDSALFNMTGSVLTFKSAPATGTYSANVTAPGGDFGANNHRVLAVTVTGPTNSAPVLASIVAQSGDELDPLAFTASASDDDGDTLEYSLAGTPPDGASINPATGVFAWTPTELQDGEHSITVTVTDGNGGSASGNVTVTVAEVNVAPALDTIGPQGVNRPGTITFKASATDGDVIDGTADALEYSLAGTPPDGASMDPATGVFSWTPAAGQAGMVTLTVQVRDGAGEAASVDVPVTVVGYAENQALGLAPAGNITNSDTLELDGANDVAIFQTGGRTYAAVASSQDNGVQIVDVTNPDSIAAAGNITDGGTLELGGANGITTFQTGGRTYAAVASFNDNGVQILDVTDPDSIAAAGSIDDDNTLELEGAYGIAAFQTGGRTYAAVASFYDDGVQILDVTDPDGIAAAGNVDDDDTLVLDGARSIATFRAGGNTYAAVASSQDRGVQILDVTDPGSVAAAGNITDGGTLELHGANGITTFQTGGRTYAAVASFNDNGVQIVDVTDPDSIAAAGSIDDDDTLELEGASDVATFQAGGRTYAAVVSSSDYGIQILDVTDPDSIAAAGNITDSDTLALAGASGIDTFQAGGYTYAAVASPTDDGVQILRLTAEAPSNARPTADAGLDLAVGEGESVMLNGTGADADGDDLTYAWTQSPPTPALVFDGANLEDPTITAPQVDSPATITLTLTVDDGADSATDTMELAIRDTSADFVTAWETTTTGEPITIPGTGSYTIDWGDGSTPTAETDTATHEYAAAGTYEVRISGGLTAIILGTDGANAEKLQSIDQWGDIGWTTMNQAFKSAASMTSDATDAPDLSRVTTMERMFDGASKFDGDISDWDVSGVTSMFFTFNNAAAFNQNITGWDVSSVTTMVSMFYGAAAFNQNITGWDVSEVTDMDSMFDGAAAFNGNLTGWNVSEVTDMDYMFQDATAFNSDISGWDVSNVAGMDDMFFNAHAFEQNLGEWYVVPDGTSIARSDVPGVVGEISAQNSFLDGHSPSYGIGTGEDSALFAVVNTNQLNMTSANTEPSYKVNVTASGPSVFENGNNWRMLDVTVTGSSEEPTPLDGTPPTLASSGLDATTGVLAITFSETIDVTHVDPTRIHVREQGNYTHGVTLTAGELDTSADSATVSFTLTAPHLAEVKGSATQELTVEPGAVRDAAGNPIVGTFDVSTATFVDAASVSTQETQPKGMAFSSDGSRMFVVGAAGDDVNEYTLSAPFDVSTATHIDAFDVSGNETSPRGMAFSSNGSRMFVVGVDSGAINEYTLSAPFDASTASFADATSVSDRASTPEGMAFSTNGTKMFVVDSTGDTINEYTLSAPFDASTASFVDATSVMTHDDYPTGMAFSSDGAKMFVVGYLGDTISEYTLSTAFDASTRSFVHAFNASKQDTSPHGMAFSSDGAKMFVVGFAGKNINEYDLSSVYPVSVTGTLNSAPTADAGPALAVGEGESVTLNGTGADADGDRLTYAWTQSPPTPALVFDDADLEDPTITAPQVDSPATITLTLTVGDGADSDTDTMELTIKNTSADFVTTWKTTTNGESITIPGTGTYDVDWGDGMTASSVTGSQTHGYASAGTYEVRISGGLTAISLGSLHANAAKLQSIDQWGDIGWTTMNQAFKGAASMTSDATDAPDLSRVTTMERMFDGAAKFDGDISDWDVSGVTSMFFTFNGAAVFDQNITGWDVSSVTTMVSMFDGAAAFNQNIAGWDVSEVTDMDSMFDGATAFNGNLTGWDVSEVTDMDYMFQDASAFNSDISGWDVSSVARMNDMFVNAHAFEQNLGEWYVVPDGTDIARADVPGTVGSISAQNPALDGHSPTYGIGEGGDSGLFEIAGGNGLNMTSVQEKSAYTVNVTASGESVFENSTSWRVLSVTVSGQANSAPTADAGPALVIHEGGVFTLSGATATDSDAGDTLAYSWSAPAGSGVAFADPSVLTPVVTAPAVSSDGNVTLTLTVDDGSDSASDTVTLAVRETSDHFVTTWETDAGGESVTIPGTGTYGVIWGDGAETAVTGTATHAYASAGTYTVSISGGLTRIHLDDSGSEHANDDRLRSIEQWGDIGWTTMNAAFRGADHMVYNATDAPDLSSVTDMNRMFRDATAFNGDVSSWNVSSVTDMGEMFKFASSFDQPLNGWDVSSVTDMSNMFRAASAFNQNIAGWDVSSVTDMHEMFRLARSFDQPLNGWNVSSVTDMDNMFRTAADFNQPLNGWDVSSVTGMNSMFEFASSFNGDISGWNVSSVTDMREVFRSASSFDQPLNGWDVSSVTDMEHMFSDAAAFNKDISGWNVSSVTAMNGMFDGATSFQQNLGEWYVVPDSTSIARADVPGTVGSISAQNPALDGHSPSYGIGTGEDSALFAVVNTSQLNMTSVNVESSYKVNVTASGDMVFENGNNWRMLDVTVTGSSEEPTPLDGTPPTFVSSEINMDTGALSITFSEAIDVTPAANVVPSKIHVRESGSRSGGVTLTEGELGTTADTDTISFALTAPHRTAVAGLTTPELTIEPGAVQDASGNPIAGTFDVSTASFVDAFSVSAQETSPQGMAFSNDGTKMFVVGVDEDDVNEYALTSAFNVSTATFANVTFSVSAQEIWPRDVAFSNDGTKMFVVGSGGDDVNEYALTTAFDVSTASFVDAFSVLAQDNRPTGTVFSNDGTKMFVVGWDGENVNEYALTSAFDVSTASFTDAFSVGSQDTEPEGMAFSSDGTKMFVVGDTGDDISGYALTTAFDVSTASFVEAFSVSAQDTEPEGMAFSSDGAKMFVVGSGGDDVNEYALTSAYPITVTYPIPTFVSSEIDMGTGALSITFSEAIDVTPAANVVPSKIHVRESGSYSGGVTLTEGELGTTADTDTISFALTASHWTAVAGLTTPELTIEPGAVQDTSGNPIAGTFDVSTASFVDAFSVSAQETSPQGVAFSNDGTKMFVVGTSGDDVNEYALTTAFNVSTATFANVTFSVSAQDATPTGMVFSNDGTKMFVVGFVGEDVNEYALTTAFDVSTASFTDAFSVGSQDTRPQAMAFSSDGTKMFVVGDSGDDISGYALTTAFDVSTASFVEAFSVSAQDTEPEGMAFSSDGAKMFVVGDSGDDISGYALTSAFDVSTASFVEAFSVSAQDTSPEGMAFSSDGTKMFVVGSSGDAVNEYALSSVYPISVTGTRSGESTTDFVTVWETTASDESIAIPGTGTYDVDWGDGMTASSVTGSQTHEYASAGNHTVRISGGLTAIALGTGSANAEKLQSIDQWGDIGWTTMSGAFQGASNMVYNATDSPDLSSVTDMSGMFYEASDFNGNISSWDVSSVTGMSSMFSDASDFNQPLNDWDVSSVTGMSGMFSGASDFNQPLNDWDVSSVTTMSSMFSGASDFNQPLNDWDVSSVTTMSSMFSGASDFNQPLNDWDVSSVTTMSSMFSGASDFNQPLNDWDVSSVTTMTSMFVGASDFNQPLNDWDVSSVTIMTNMFSDADAFNQPLNDWDVSSVTSMSNMFYFTSAFNGDISGWNVSSVTAMTNMFSDAAAFNKDISGWNVSSVTAMNGMFDDAPSFQQNLGEWYVVPDSASIARADVPGVVGEISAQNSALDGHSPTYGIGAGGDFGLFGIADGNGLNMTSVQAKSAYTVNVTASGSSVFENGNNWRVLNVTVSGQANSAPTADAGPDLAVGEGESVTLNGTGADADGDDLTYAWTQSPTSPALVFDDANLEDPTITAPQVDSPATITLTLTVGDGADSDTDTMELAIRDTSADFVTVWETTASDESITIPGTGTYNVDWGDGITASSVTGSQTHEYATAGTYEIRISGGLERINLYGSDSDDTNDDRLRSIEQWGDIGWTTMSGAFRGASNMAYNADDVPDLSSVTDMSSMFYDASAFNGNISPWDVSSVTNMSGMFSGASAFNQPLPSWVVSSVTDMDGMFSFASAFNGNISPWDVSSVTDMRDMFFGATAFNQDISGWDVSSVTDMGGMFSFTSAFNGNISPWDVSSVTDMRDMFFEASAFNQPLPSWVVSSVTGMNNMFDSASSFNGNISSWDVSSVTDMRDMFSDASAFNQPLNDWDVSSVTNMSGMFSGASAFNQPLSSWDVSSVTDMDGMFLGATSFQQNLGEWYVVPDSTSIARADVPGTVGSISAQNSVLDGHSPTYGIGESDDKDLFEIVNGNELNMTSVGTESAYEVNVTASGTNVFEDGNSWRMLDVTVTGQANADPVLGSIGAKSVNELASLTFTATATDGDNDTLEFTLAGTPPSGASVTSTGSFSWTPSESQDGTHAITIQVEDGNGGIDSEAVTVTVSEVNEDPVLNPIGPKSVDELASLAFTATATDGDVIGGTADTLEFSLGAGAPTGASITSGGSFSWTPSESQDGTHAITIQVEDGAGATDSEAVTVTVSEVNEDPVLNPIGPKSVNQLEALTFTATASDGDVTGGTADTLEFSLGAGAPTGASINQNTGAFSWTPTASQVGTHTITFQVEDGAGATDSEAVTVTVTESNENPVLGSIGAKGVDELAALSFAATATDGDNDTLEFTLVGTPPSGASITPGGAFSWTPSEPQDGAHSVTVRVSDGNGGSDSETIVVTVSEVNQAPVLNPIGPKGVNRPGTLTFTATASDGDVIGGTADSLGFSLAGTPPPGASIDPATGAFSWTPTAGQVGTHTITIRVEDGAGAADSEEVTVRITADSVDPPTTRSGGGSGGSTRSQAPALDFGTLKSYGLAPIPQDIAQLLRAFDRDEPIRPVNATGPLDAPLVINGSAYMLGGIFNTLEPQALKSGEPTSIIFTVYSRADIVHFTVYMNLQGSDPRQSASDTYIRFDRGTVSTADPNGFIAGASVTITQDPGAAYKYRIQVDVEFAKGMEQTSMIIGLRSARSAPTAVYAINAFEVLPPAAAQAEPDVPAPEPDMPAPEPDAPSYQEPPASPTAAFRMWAGFGPAAIGDAELVAALGLDYPGAEIPMWMKTGLAPLVVKDHVTLDEFTTALGYVLGAIQDRGTKDAAGSQPADLDAIAPTVASIERSDPAGESTSEATLVFGVTFGEDVTGVDAGDFALSPDSGGGPGRFTQTSAPALAIPDNAAAVSDAITVPGFGTVASVSVAVDIAHPFIGDLTVELVAPDGAIRTLHDRSGGNADGIKQTYAPDFGGAGIAGDWALRVSDRAPGDAGTLNGWTLTVGHDGAGGSVTGLAGSGSQYLVTVSAPQGGTYNLDVVRDSGIADMAGNPLADAAPTGADHTYTVVADTTAPTVTSIERSDPAEESTSEQILVFGVTFGEDVTGVDADDFALSTDGASGQFTHTSTPALAIPDNAAAVSDAITVPGFGTVASVSVAVDIAHPYIDDLTVELVAPDGAIRTLHDRSGGNADGIKQTYAPDFGGAGIAGDWALRVSDGASGDTGTLNGWTLTVGHDGAGGSVTGLAGSGSRYLVTVSAAQEGTYNLDVIRDSGIADAAGNPLADAAPTGPDHTYTVVADTTAPTVTSIERSDPAEGSTSEQTLVFAVTFSEGVTGVDADDFALSPDSGGGPGQFTHTRMPGLAIPDNAAAVSDAITVPGFGTATSVSVAVDIAHPFIGDLMVELVAPGGTAKTLHRYSGEGTDDIVRTYTPDFAGTGIAGDWTLRVGDRASGDAGTLNGWTLTVNHGGADSPVTGLAGSGSQYLVTVSAPQGGTYNLDVVRDSGIADMAGNPLADAAPTGPDHTYTVVADTTAPTVTSIERSDPAEGSTSEQTLVFAVTFSEGVTGVDADDFALSPDSGGGPGQFTHTRMPGLAIPDNAAAVSDAITVPGFGTATSVSVAVDIAHPFIGDLMVELVAPGGTAKTLHRYSGEGTDDIVRTYTPDFAGTGIAGDWTLRVGDRASGDAGTLNGWTLTVNHGGADSPVTGLAGSGSQYLVTVSAPQGGTYNLDVVRDSGIADMAGNPLADAAPTGADHTYARTGT